MGMGDTTDALKWPTPIVPNGHLKQLGKAQTEDSLVHFDALIDLQLTLYL